MYSCVGCALHNSQVCHVQVGCVHGAPGVLQVAHSTRYKADFVIVSKDQLTPGNQTCIVQGFL